MNRFDLKELDPTGRNRKSFRWLSYFLRAI